VPPMPMQERVQFARELAKKHGNRLTEIENWLPLLRYTQGNPLTITVVVGQALRNGYRSKEQIEQFVADLRSGEAELDDDESEGRSRSLGVSLRYGFSNTFNEYELQQLALLYLFQGFVNVGTVCLMGFPEAEWCVPTISNLTFEACYTLLARAAEVGLLTKFTENDYGVHPALPWYFKRLFDRYYSKDNYHLVSPTRAFAEAMGVVGQYCNNQYDEGNRDVIAHLTCEEANLLYARHLAHSNNWWNALLKTVQGLLTLYEYTGRRMEWARLVVEIKPSFVDSVTNSSLPEREEEWGIVTQYCVQLAREEQRWVEAEQLNCARVKWARHRASSLANSSERLNITEYQTIRTLAVSLHERGQIRREQDKPDCIESYEEAFALLEQIGDQAGAAVYALNVGHAYSQIPALRDLLKAEQWYQHSLKLRAQNDFLGRGKCLIELGRVANECFREARSSNRSEAELSHHLNQAIQYFHQALNLIPQNAIAALAIAHNQLGNVCRSAEDLDHAFLNYREALRYQEAQGDLYSAADTCFNIALIRIQAKCFDEALLYAKSAIYKYKTFGDRAIKDIQDAQNLISLIEGSEKQ
jgi:tetratricopeptide (TPR) repeat protein